MNDYRKKFRHKSTVASSLSNAQALILSGLNVLQILEVQAPKYLQNLLHYGPNSFVGKDWAAALIWFRQKGYHQYKNLTIFGVWAVANHTETELRIGTKQLQFSAPVFNPESYMQLIKHNFQTHYKDDGSPPPDDNIVRRINYDAAQRLALRQDIADAIIHWMRNRR
jgi:hypothetical protein